MRNRARFLSSAARGGAVLLLPALAALPWLSLDPLGRVAPWALLAGALWAAWGGRYLPPLLPGGLLSLAMLVGAHPLLGPARAFYPAFPAAALLAALLLTPGRNPEEDRPGPPPWTPGAWAAALGAGLLAGRLAPELHTLDPGSPFWGAALWFLLPGLVLLGAFLLSRARAGALPGFLLLLAAPWGLARTLASLSDFSTPRGAVKAANALAVTLGLSTEAPPPLDPLAGTLWSVYPPPGAVLLLQASLAALPLLLLGGAWGALRAEPREGPTRGTALGAAFFVLGALAGPSLEWKAAGPALPLLAFSALLLPPLGEADPWKEWGLKKRTLLALPALLSAGAALLFLPQPPPLAAPFSQGGFTARDVPAGRLALPPAPRIPFLDGLPLHRPGGQIFLLQALPGESGASLFLGPPGFSMPTPWKTRSFLDPREFQAALEEGPWKEILLGPLTPDHRALGALLSRESLVRAAASCRRLLVALDLSSLEGRKIPILARRLLEKGRNAALLVGLGGFTPPLLLARLGPPPAERPKGFYLAADRKRMGALAALAGPAWLEPWSFQPPPAPEPRHGRIRPALLLLSRKDLPGRGPRPGVAACLRALAARWRTPPPPDPVGHDPERALVPTREELEALTEGLREDPIPLLEAYAERLGDLLLKPSIQRLGLARPFLRTWARLLPGKAAFARLLGTLHARLLEYEEALPLLEKAWKLGKGERRTLRELGLVLFGLGRWRAAAARLRALSPDPARDLEAARALGLALFRVGDPEAKAWIAKVRALDPWDKEVEKAASALGIR